MRTEQAEPENAEGPGWLARTLAWWVAVVCRWPRLFLAGSLLLAAVSIAFAWANLKYQTQRDDLLSPHKDFFKRWQQYVREFGEDDDMVVVVKSAQEAQGDMQPRMKKALDDLAGHIAARPDRFTRLFYRVDLQHLRNRALLFLPFEQIRQIQDNLQDMNLLLDPPVLRGFDPLFSWKSVTLQMLVLEAQRRLTGVRSEDAASDARVLRQLDAVCRAAADALERPGSYRSPWQDILPRFPEDQARLDQPQYFFSKQGNLAFLLVRPVRQLSFTGTQQSVNALRKLIGDLKASYTDLQIGLTGLPVLEDDEMAASERDSQRAAWLALAGVAILYLVFYRRWRYPVFTVATLLVGNGWAMGWTTLTVGHLNILSAAFAVMLIGMGDYGVLWVTRYGQERKEGADLQTAMANTAGSVGPGILVAGITTALAFFATMLADFKAIVELGWIAGCGVLLCALACFIVLPAMLALWDGRRRKHGQPRKPRVIRFEEVKNDRREWLPGLMRRPGLVLGGSAAIFAVFAILALGVHYDHNLLHMQARGLESVRWEKTLIRNTAGASWHALSYTSTPEEALALKARFEKLSAVSQVVEVASLVPRDQDRKLEQLRDIQHRLKHLPPKGLRIGHLLPRPAELCRALDRLLEGIDQASFEPQRQLLGSLKTRARALRDKLAAADPDKAGRFLQDFEERMTTDLAADLHRLREVSHAEPITIADLPESLRGRYIGKNGQWLVCVFAKNSLWDFAPLESFIAQVQTVDPEATGKPFTTLEGLRAMKESFLWAALYAAIAMFLVLLLDFRSLKCTLVALGPVIMGLCMTFGAMYVCGIPLNPANMIALPLILGVGMDNGVHVLHDYRSRPPGAYSLTHATGRGILVAGLTTILGFGTLMISSHRGIASLGLALSLGVSCCMLCSLVTLPALLRLLSGRAARVTQHAKPMRRAA